MNTNLELRICGLQKTTLLDYPGHVACTIFVGGCNFRCPFCHNSELLGSDVPPEYSEAEILSFLKKRRGILEGVCVTGGEPTLQPEALEAFLGQVRALGLLIKLDTNGSRPDVIRRLADNGLVDMIAMDIKAAPEHYAEVCGAPGLNLAPIRESVEWLKAGRIPYEFRTTAVNGLHTAADFEGIGPWIAGCPHYYIQNYVESDLVLEPHGFSGFTKEELLSFAALVSPYAGEVSLRGIDY
ncbi:MAG: anaerobic ribonucleoside-triphosphate reductase activating protein [Lachnospiraceae bacterium]|nr:anaerobic ribonucleoside-triphosphate reductase activating protein [Lachnospiraceae bacterium]